jgi:hypothetical protein
LRGLLFDPEDGGGIFFRNVSFSPNYTALQLRKPTANAVRTSNPTINLAEEYHLLGYNAV